MSAGAIVMALLDASPALTALVGARKYGLARPEGDPLPAVVWVEISDGPIPPIDATAGSEPCEARVQVNCLAPSAASAQAVKDAVIAACHKSSGTIAGATVMAVLQDIGGPDTYDALVDTYQKSVDLVIYYMR